MLRAMRFDGRETEIEQRRHLFVRASFGQKLQHFLLTVGQQVIGVGEARVLQLAHVVLDEHRGRRPG